MRKEGLQSCWALYAEYEPVLGWLGAWS